MAKRSTNCGRSSKKQRSCLGTPKGGCTEVAFVMGPKDRMGFTKQK